MPLRQTKYGGECPLGVFEIDVAAGGGCYTGDPLESCLGNPELDVSSCNYFNFENEEFDPAKQCMCPADMTKPESRRLKCTYADLVEKGLAEKTKKGFWKFVEKNHQVHA